MSSSSPMRAWKSALVGKSSVAAARTCFRVPYSKSGDRLAKIASRLARTSCRATELQLAKLTTVSLSVKPRTRPRISPGSSAKGNDMAGVGADLSFVKGLQK